MTELDLMDLRILRTLVRDGRISNTQLAQEVGFGQPVLATGAQPGKARGHRRVSRCVGSGELGAAEVVMIEVILERHDDDILESFGSRMQKMPEVVEVLLTTGEYDYLIKVAVNDTRGYEAFLRNKLYRVPGIRHTRSSFVLRSLRHAQAYLPE